MNPDTIIAALREELAELERAQPDDFADRKKQIEEKIKEVDEQPRPAVKSDDDLAGTVYDRSRAVLEALNEELKEPRDDEHEKQIKAEIKRVEGEIAARTEKPDASERAERSTSRATNTPKGERAVSAPADK